MFRKTNSAIVAAVAVTLSAISPLALASDGQVQQQRIDQLEAKVAALEAERTQDARDVARTIDSVLRDAERRSQLLATSGDSAAGYDNGFYIRTGEFSLRPTLLFQFRNITDFRRDAASSGDDEIENGFEVRRMQFIMQGNAFSKDLNYRFQWATDRNSGTLVLEDAYVAYMFADEWGLRVGQWKDRVSHEKIMTDSRIVTVERSLLDATLAGGYFDRVQGVNLIYGGGTDNKRPWNIEAGISDGANSKNTDFTGHFPNSPPAVGDVGAPSTHAFDFGIAGRTEYKFSGDWKNYSDFTAKGTKDNLLVVGAGGDWSQGGDGNSLVGTVDAQFETASGIGVYGALVVRHRDDQLTPTGEDATDWGALIQASYLLSPSWEVFGRWDGIWYDNSIASAGGEDFFHEWTAGVNYYLGKDGSFGHRAKITIDVNWLPNGAPGAFTGQGYIGDSGGENEIAIRGQFQLLI